MARSRSARAAQVRCSTATAGAPIAGGARRGRAPQFDTVDTAADDTCLIAFTSGTTGVPKGTMHFHRDVMAACACWPPHVLRAARRRRVHRQPAAGLHLRPGRPAAVPAERSAPATVLLEKASPEALLPAIAATSATVCFTAPTSYRAMAAQAAQHDLGSLRKCVSAGEALPAATRLLWKRPPASS
jgi:2-aminobenzoate-CoA ligase